ncbi:hypothetical protein H704_00772 [Bartonella bacilliformis Peru38]|uniref:thermonuclease family protein n=1 Tax=Bartonella bacilliformis TaxID=774 RepID=UPI00044B7507|nr:thermonuclease family protein [Bartonella bacilliformis]EYS95202.1 hypothetical protein X470_00722 [Bartonella bacilliformis Peru-18]KEG16883.1 hypothetical protein H705_00771 [Bartonella bacilliformis Cond044]KEG17271.1 hypothetical protein H709_00614 [Bartonella bacilliformis CUSCO5]KEG20527.1 hypothetical protein H704_00772 [Bartonella bacilliformis Peru38]KEG22909.1 hypothetical protein H703_00758 [Bartonella bacilliformis Ver075]
MKEKVLRSNLDSFKKKVFGLIVLVTIIFTNMIVYTEYAQTQKPISIKSIKGYASVIDGDSIKVADIMVRLIGIDSPELHQFCGMKTKRYPCGQKAKEYLEKLITKKTVTCHWSIKDKYQRVLGTCQTKQVKNINATMVQNGWAVSYNSYRKEEEEAHRKKKGIWQSSFQQPREWRRIHINNRTQ